VFVVASARQGFDPGEILLEWEGVRRDSPPSRQTGQEIAGTLDARAEAGGFPGTDGACANRVVPADAGGRLTNRLSPAFCGGNCKGPIPVATALNANERFDFDSETFIVEPTECVTGSVTHTLTAEGFDASEDGTGRGNPIVPIAFTAKDYGQNATEDMSPTLRSGAHSDSHANGGVMPAVAYSIRTAQTGANGIGVDEHLSPTLDVAGSPSVCYSFKPGMSEAAGGLMPTEDVAPTLQAADNGSTRTPAVAYAIQERAICENPDAGPDGIGVREDVAYTLEARQTPQAIGFVQNSSEVRLMGGDGAIAGALAAEPGAQQQTYIASHMAVRRLMPVECERLQGFPDEWTRIPVKFFTTKQVSALRPDDMWEVGFGPGNRPGWWLMAADGPRYKQCGNSMARNCMAWIGGRIKDWLQLEPFRELIG
jgi:DNA (cytosine-5)-methyltransferase 1